MWVWRACVGAVLLLSLWASAALQQVEQDDALASTGVVSEPELTDLRRFSRSSDQYQGNEVAYQSSRVALTGHSPTNRRRVHRPFVRRRVFIVDGDAGGRAARRSVDGAQSAAAADRSTRVRVGSYFNSNLTHRLSDERAFFSWNGRRGSGGRGGWRRRQPAIAASALRTNGTTYDRRGPVRTPRPGDATGGVVVTRLPGRTVYRNASGTYVRRVGATIRHPMRVEPQRSLPPLTTHQRHVTLLNHTVITNRTVVASSLARQDPTNRSSSSSSAAISVSSVSSNTSPAHQSAVFHNAGFSAPTGRHESSFSSGSSGSFSFQSLSQSADSSTLRAHQMFDAHSSTSPPSIAASSPSASVTTAGNGEALGRQRAAGSHSVDGSGNTNVHIAAELRRAYIQRNRLQTIGAWAQSGTCERGSCLPASGNLLVGRQRRLFASSTCGLEARDRYCIVSNLKDKKSCYWCDSRRLSSDSDHSSLDHRIENVIRARRDDPRGHNGLTWWQAENGRELVYIQLDLEAEFHFTHLIMKFRTFRPKAMLIERSYDGGRSWHVYRYFAESCSRFFPGVPVGYPRRITDVTCEERYSRVEPSERGEVIFRALPPRLTPKNPYSTEVQNLLKITNLRVNFTRLHTLGDDLLDQRREIKEKYYYAVYEMTVGGRCSCYGHAPRCLPLPAVTASAEAGMVHGRCDCIHNTAGLNCQRCLPFHHDLPWRPAVGKQTNACKRCECHGHSRTCQFSEQRYNETGYVSGGVCIECGDNTAGANCDRCVVGFYRRADTSLSDPHVCQPCECVAAGSLDNGVCEPRDVDARQLTAGQCHCKRHVTGATCHQCRVGFWNLSTVNPHGCQPCECDVRGSVAGGGCDAITGACQCKPNVQGARCDRCMPAHYSLGGSQQLGCVPCQCDAGGAYSFDCDVISGQCRCRPNLTGRTCSQPKENYFGGTLDFLVYEAEQAEPDERSLVEIREPSRDGRVDDWTGDGVVRVGDGSQLRFFVDNIVTNLLYDVVVRYELKSDEVWDGVLVTIVRDSDDPVDPDGLCASIGLSQETRQLTLQSDERYVVASQPVCLESGKRYTVVLHFPEQQAAERSRDMDVLIDSVVLIPRVDLPQPGPAHLAINTSTSNSDGDGKTAARMDCERFVYSVLGKEDMPDECRSEMISKSYVAFEGAKDKACDCDPTGSESALCDPLGGQCRCKPNVVGRRCHACAPGTYGFGPEGCAACECNAVGALHNWCDTVSGQCVCRNNTYGRRCDQCQLGFWGHPDCRRCECNGHAATCDPSTGHCQRCADQTTGDHCERCKESYYGDPRLDVDIACRPCQCPGAAVSGHWHATACHLASSTQALHCQCETGYAGERCDTCADGFFGRPSQPPTPNDNSNECRRCRCNNNVDPTVVGNCNTTSGHCLRCLFNTAGEQCHRCADGFYGDAVNGSCRECACNMLGTDATAAGACDATTGQCRCLPNVMGRQCDRCVPAHWKIAIGSGCEPCDCDPAGSTDEQCNEYDGQCRCRAGFGGRRCDQCEPRHWGDPRRGQCRQCQCNSQGSAAAQCDRESGRCQCRSGIGGDRCDRCARGHRGQAPDCQPCGECFDNWDRVLQQLQESTNAVVDEAEALERYGATGVYGAEFAQLNDWLDDVRHVLGNASLTDQQLDQLQLAIQRVRLNLSESESQLQSVETLADNTTHRLLLLDVRVPALRTRAQQLHAAAAALRDNATRLQEADVDGALALTREAQRRSKAAEISVMDTQRSLAEAGRQRRRTDNLLARATQRFNESRVPVQQLLRDATARLHAVEQQLPDINSQVCDGGGAPCDALCGGGGCDRCGGLSCDDGAATRAANALSVATDTVSVLAEREREVDELLRRVTAAKLAADEAYSVARAAFSDAQRLSNSSQQVEQRLQQLLEQIEELLQLPAATPQDIQRLAQQVLSKSISLRPEQISRLASEINETMSSLTDVNSILAETANDLNLANSLKQRADKAKQSAETILKTAEAVTTALQQAGIAQSTAGQQMTDTDAAVQLAQQQLASIVTTSLSAERDANASVVAMQQLKARHKIVIKEFARNEINVARAVKEASLADEMAGKAHQKAEQLDLNYRQAMATLNNETTAGSSSRLAVKQLLAQTSSLLAETVGQLNELEEINLEFSRHEDILSDMSDEIDSLHTRLDSYLHVITTRAEHYRTCQS